MRWLVTPSGGSPITTAESDSITSLRPIGITIEPLSIEEQDSVLTVNGTELRKQWNYLGMCSCSDK